MRGTVDAGSSPDLPGSRHQAGGVRWRDRRRLGPAVEVRQKRGNARCQGWFPVSQRAAGSREVVRHLRAGRRLSRRALGRCGSGPADRPPSIRGGARGRRGTRDAERGFPYSLKRAAGIFRRPPVRVSRRRAGRERGARGNERCGRAVPASCRNERLLRPRSDSLGSAPAELVSWRAPARPCVPDAAAGALSEQARRWFPASCRQWLHANAAFAHHHSTGAPAAAGRAAELEILQRLVAQHR